MTAGRGIVHSERRPPDLAGRAYGLHGLQLCVALPADLEETAPSFSHTPAELLPRFSAQGAHGRVLVGSAFGMHSPVAAASPTTYLDLALDADSSTTIPPLAQELALYSIDEELRVDGQNVAPHVLAVLDAQLPVHLEAGRPNRLVLIGGDRLTGRRLIWWNFVSTRRQRILDAAADWEARRMPGVAGDDSYIPLPERRPNL